VPRVVCDDMVCPLRWEDQAAATGWLVRYVTSNLPNLTTVNLTTINPSA
jgi:hypothetical protein